MSAIDRKLTTTLKGWWYWCNGVVIFPYHTSGHLVLVEHCINITAYLSTVADPFHPIHTHLLMTISICSLFTTSVSIFLSNQYILIWQIHTMDVQLTNLQQLDDTI